MGRGRRRRSPSEESLCSEDYYDDSYGDEEEEEQEESRSRSRSRRRHHRPHRRGHGGHSRHHHHRHRHRDRERDRDRDRHRGRGQERGREASKGNPGNDGGSGDWRRDLKEFIRKNRLDERTQAALRGLDKPVAKQVMGIDGGTNSFILEGVRNPDAVVMSRIRRCSA